MGSIYKSAETVIVWLGPEDVSTNPAIDLMNGLFGLRQQHRLELHPYEAKTDHPNSLLNLTDWQALARLFQREWLNRAWMEVPEL